MWDQSTSHHQHIHISYLNDLNSQKESSIHVKQMYHSAPKSFSCRYIFIVIHPYHCKCLVISFWLVMSSKRESVSIIIPHYNCLEYIFDAIDSAKANISDGDEIVIVDDGSEPYIVELIIKYVDNFDYINFIRHAQNQGGGRLEILQ